MSIKLSSNFDLVTQLPLDARFVKADTTARDAITAIQRYEGLLVYTVADSTLWQLVGGVTNSDWSTVGTGAAGADGKSVLNGTGAPGGGVGTDGDFYIDTATYDIYGPKAAGVWGSPTSLVGPQGPQGDPGDTVAVDWEGTEIVAAASRLNFKGPGVASVVESSPGVVDVLIQGGGGSTDEPLQVFGECDTPLDIPATGLLEADDFMSREAMDQLVFVQGDAGPVDVTADPQIDGHVFPGAMLTIIGRSNSSTLKFSNGRGLVLNGTAELRLASVLRLMWNGALWIEKRRNF